MPIDLSSLEAYVAYKMSARIDKGVSAVFEKYQGDTWRQESLRDVVETALEGDPVDWERLALRALLDLQALGVNIETIEGVSGTVLLRLDDYKHESQAYS